MASADNQENSGWKPRHNPWLIAVVVSMAAFMEVLDTSIANVALPHMAGNLGASQDQSTWVLTSYLVSNAIVLPITGWLTSIVGRKRFFLICIVIFTLSSLLCGIAPSLVFLLMARVVQGAGGGGLQPMAQAILADIFPPEKRGLAFSLYGITAVCAPAIGPTLGGWLTDNYSWRWIFLINLPVGLITMFLVHFLVDDPPFLKRKTLRESRLDYVGLSALALGIGSLQIVLDKGQEDDWFSSHFITTLVIITVVCLTFLVIWEWYEKDPIVDVRLFKYFNFSASSVMMFLVGAVSFSSTVLMPQFLQSLMGYTAEKAGMVLSAAAIILLIELPIVGILTGKIQGRFIMAIGWGMLCVAMYVSTKQMDLLISFRSASILRIIQYIPIGLVFIPATTVAYVGIPQEKSNSVAGLVNFMRNIGSSFGTSAVTTILAQRSQFHQARLTEHTAIGDINFQNMMSGASQSAQSMAGNGHLDARQVGLAQIYQTVQTQAASLSYLDVFQILMVLGGIMFFLSFLLRGNKPKKQAMAAH
ncbi:DHA2 family efflux MFS transporter permease subunit [Edaphobacter aggregans]|uniref:DHA2 family efflux MFS transporter permease subunit n=1 Tax=Edaphobacter aggregans TaxID=570835 RepID=UPI00054E98C6|nr:DHA2 family efflux MFS transporter permease subunit [Edaphobacter aggregans]